MRPTNKQAQRNKRQAARTTKHARRKGIDTTLLKLTAKRQA